MEIMNDCMTAAEFAATVRGLGLSHENVADLAGVRIRAVQYWASGGLAVPEQVGELLKKLETRQKELVRHFVSKTIDLIESPPAGLTGPPKFVAIVAYKTAVDFERFQPDFWPQSPGYHLQILRLAARELAAGGVNCRLVYMIPELYDAWLIANGLEDDSATRSAWAADTLAGHLK